MELLDQLKEYGVDVDTGVARFVGKQDLYVKFLGKFLQDTSFEGMKNSIEQKQYLEAFEYAHSLKGVCGNLSLSPVTEQVSELTEILRNKETLSESEQQKVQELLDAMTKSYGDVVQILKQHLA
jgi:Hpt domain.